MIGPITTYSQRSAIAQMWYWPRKPIIHFPYFFQNEYWKPLTGPKLSTDPLETIPLEIIMRVADLNYRIRLRTLRTFLNDLVQKSLIFPSKMFCLCCTCTCVNFSTFWYFFDGKQTFFRVKGLTYEYYFDTKWARKYNAPTLIWLRRTSFQYTQKCFYVYTHYEIKGSKALFQYSRYKSILTLFAQNWVLGDP